MNDFKVDDYEPDGTYCEDEGLVFDLADFNADGR